MVKNDSGIAGAGIDLTPVDPAVRLHVDSLARREGERLADSYHPDAVVVLSAGLARVSKATRVARNTDEVRHVLDGLIQSGTLIVNIRDYIQVDDTIVVRYDTFAGGAAAVGFAAFVLRDGQIWRHVAGLEGASIGSRPFTLEGEIHPVFQRQVKHLAAGELDELIGTYRPDARMVVGATNSWGFRSRGAAVGHEPIRDFLTAYIDAGSELVELKEYVEVGDTIFVQGTMKQGGVAEDSWGAYVIDGDRISHQMSGCAA